MSAHLKGVCSAVVVQCKFHHFGCPEEVRILCRLTFLGIGSSALYTLHNVHMKLRVAIHRLGCNVVLSSLSAIQWRKQGGFGGYPPIGSEKKNVDIFYTM